MEKIAHLRITCLQHPIKYKITEMLLMKTNIHLRISYTAPASQFNCICLDARGCAFTITLYLHKTLNFLEIEMYKVTAIRGNPSFPYIKRDR